MAEGWSRYHKAIVVEMRPYTTGEDLAGVQVAPAYQEAGSPKSGDMLARDPQAPDKLWLIAASDAGSFVREA
jgi:hypothetical protein